MNKIKLTISLLTAVSLIMFFSCNNKQQQKVEDINEENIRNEKSGLPQDETTKVLNLPNGKKIYVRAKVWGISSNHEEIVFSETPISKPDKEKDYIFYTDEVFYKLDGNTLNIYACDCDTSEPKNLFDGVKIILNDLRTSSKIKDYSKNYIKYGLERARIYDK